MRRSIGIAFLLAVGSLCAPAQWLNYRSSSTPRTPDGKPNLAAPSPRTSNGKPDLSGVWRVEPTPFDELVRLYGDMTAFSVPGDDPHSLSKYTLNVFADLKRGEEPLRPEAAAA